MHRARSIVGPAVAVLVLVSAAPLFAGEEAPAPISAWAADDLTKINPEGKPIVADPPADYRDRNPVWNGTLREVRLDAARNEWVAFQVIIEGGPAGLPEATVEVSDLTSAGGTIPKSRFALFGEYYTQVTTPSRSPAWSLGPGWYPDGLVPFELVKEGHFDVEANYVQGVWVDLYVPADAVPGKYEGRVTVSAPEREPSVLKLVLDVRDFALPAESHLRWRFGYNERLAEAHDVPFDRRTSEVGQRFLDLELDFYRLCRAHRVTPTTHYTTPIPDHSGQGADLTIDWTSYDRRFGRYLDGSAFDDGVPVNVFSLPVNPQSYGGWPSSTRPGGRSDLGGVDIPLARYRADLDSFRRALELTVEHWREKGWNLDNAFVYVADEPNAARYNLIRDHCRVISEVEPRIFRSVAFYRAFGVNGAKIVKDFRDFVNYWEIAGDYMARTALDGLRERGDWVAIYQGSAPFQGGEALDMDGVALATWPWIAWMYELDSLFIYMGTMWETRDIWDDPDNQGWPTNSQGVLLYPGLKFGVKRVLPSIRLKQMRRGMQDYEYMWLLSAKGKKEIADDAVESVIHKALQDASPGKFGDSYYAPGPWEHNSQAWFDARRRMADALLATETP